MKRAFFGLFFLAVILVINGCNRDDTEELKEQELRLLNQYLYDNGITQEPTTSGLYFILLEDVEGVSPTIEDVVEFEFTGRLIDNRLFGTSNQYVAEAEGIYSESQIYGPTRLILKNSIAGLAEGFQLMEEGETAMMILPSDIAYGGNPPSGGIIQRYSTLILTIHLLKVISDPVAYEDTLIKNFIDERGLVGQPTESGIYYFETVEGQGDYIADRSRVSLYYSGYFLDGREFDTNYDDQTPWYIVIPSTSVITGFNEGLKLMKEGSIGTLIIPYNLGFGEEGYLSIPPCMTLVFDIEIVSVD